MKNLKLYTLLFISTILWSCGPNVNTTKMTNADLGKYDTFAYLPNTNFDDKDIGYNDKSVGYAVIQSVNKNLEKVGYELDRQKPDLLVSIRTKMDIDKETVKDPVYATYPYATARPVNPYYDPFYYTYYNDYTQIVGYENDTYKLKEGTLMIDLIDRETKKIVWRGVASDQIYQNNNSQAISEYVDDIFKKLPNIASM